MRRWKVSVFGLRTLRDGSLAVASGGEKGEVSDRFERERDDC